MWCMSWQASDPLYYIYEVDTAGNGATMVSTGINCGDSTMVGEALYTFRALGDLDGDGCDELAVTSADADMGESNQGALRILWGAGASCASRSSAVSNFWPARDDDDVFRTSTKYTAKLLLLLLL